MEYRLLGRTNLKASAIGIGVWQLSGPLILDGKDDGYPDVGYDNAVNLIRACEDLGINLIDSAEIYGAGEGERRVGEAIRGRRDKWILSTKFGLRRGETGERIVNSRPDTIRTSLENSLRRLQTDYVDIYLYHTPPEPELVDAGKAVLEALKQEGKLRFYGISTNNTTNLQQLLAKDAVDVVMFSQSIMTHPPEMLGLVKQHNLGALVRGAFQGGLLSGKYFYNRPVLPQSDIRQSWLNTQKTERYAVLEKYIPTGASMVSLALRYLLDFDTTQTIVLGGKSLSEYQNAVQAVNLPPLDAVTRKDLEKVGQELQRFYSRSQFKQKVIRKIKGLLSK